MRASRPCTAPKKPSSTAGLPGHRRFKVNLVGMGVVEATDNPDLRPNIPLPAKGFNLGMIQAEKGNGAALARP